MLSNRPEFQIADLAAMTLGATPFSIYATSSPEQIAYVVGDAEAKVAIIEQAFAGSFQAARGDLPALETVIGGGGRDVGRHVAWADVEATESDFDVEAAWRGRRARGPDHAIYTSGTTGPAEGRSAHPPEPPRGRRGSRGADRFPDGSKVISWLPAAHIAERMAHHYLPIVYAMTITCCPNPREVVGYLPAVRPTWFFAVPRIWEKLKAGMEGFLASGEDGSARASRLDASRCARSSSSRPASRCPEDLAATVAKPTRSCSRASAGHARLRSGRGRQRRRSAPPPRRGARLLPRDRVQLAGVVGDVRRPAAPAAATRTRRSRSAPMSPLGPRCRVAVGRGR
jgi:hypothetical protein